MKETFCWGIYRGNNFNELWHESYRTRKEAIRHATNLFGENWRTIKRKYRIKAVRCMLVCKNCG